MIEIQVVSRETTLIFHIETYQLKNGENGVVKPKCQQETSLNKMLSNFSKVLIAQISFTAVINNGGIEKGIGGIRKGVKKNHQLRFVTYSVKCVAKKENQNRGLQIILPPCPKKCLNFSQLLLFLLVGQAKPLWSLAPV